MPIVFMELNYYIFIPNANYLILIKFNLIIIFRGLNNLKISITFLYQEDGGIEVHASCEVSLILSVFSKQINAFMKKQGEQFISDLSRIE